MFRCPLKRKHTFDDLINTCIDWLIYDILGSLTHITCEKVHRGRADTHDRTAKVTRVMARQKMEMEQPTYPMVDSAARWPAVSCAEWPTRSQRSIQWRWSFWGKLYRGVVLPGQVESRILTIVYGTIIDLCVQHTHSCVFSFQISAACAVLFHDIFL